MARQDDGQRVLAVGGADRPCRVAAELEPTRLLAVAHGLSVPNGREGEPATALEGGSVQLERQVKRHEVTVEVSVELSRGFGEAREICLRRGCCGRRIAAPAV